MVRPSGMISRLLRPDSKDMLSKPSNGKSERSVRNEVSCAKRLMHRPQADTANAEPVTDHFQNIRENRKPGNEELYNCAISDREAV
jgi:hypothetical protein